MNDTKKERKPLRAAVNQFERVGVFTPLNHEYNINAQPAVRNLVELAKNRGSVSMEILIAR
jgi:hypothetical protein